MKINQTPIVMLQNVNIQYEGKVKRLKAGETLVLSLDVASDLVRAGYAKPIGKMVKVINAFDLRHKGAK